MARKSATVWTLRESDLKVTYSNSERRVFALLPQDGGRIDSKTIAKRFYARLGPPPYHGQKIVMSALESLRKKVEYNKEPFRIIKSERRGQWPIEVWLSAA